MDRRAFALGSLTSIAAGRALAVTEDEPSFKSGGKSVGVEWFAPSGAKDGARSPAILLLHGAEGLMLATGYRSAARLIAQRGIGVAFVHYFDRTGEKIGSMNRMRTSFPPWAAAIRDALGWLAARPDVDPDKIGIVGVSLGAALALHVAASGETRIKAIVDFFGPISAGVLPKKPKLPPVLILHGAADETVPIIHARTLEAVLKDAGTPYEIKIYPGQGHGFTGFAQIDASRRASAFLAQHLGLGLGPKAE